MKENYENLFDIVGWLSVVSCFAMIVTYFIEIQIDNKAKHTEAMLQKKIDSLELVIKLKHETKK